jgi:F-type H+-transporting ATPase subunit 8
MEMGTLYKVTDITTHVQISFNYRYFRGQLVQNTDVGSRINKINMPQLTPFFFVNQVVFSFILLTIIIYMFSKYILPRFVRLFKTRLHINSL